MQINLPIDPAPPSPPAAKLPAAPSHQQGGSSFEHFLGSGEHGPTPKGHPAESAASKPDPKTAPKLEEKAEEKPAEVDPTAAATLAALSVNFPLPLPPPPTTPVELQPAAIATPAVEPAVAPAIPPAAPPVAAPIDAVAPAVQAIAPEPAAVPSAVPEKPAPVSAPVASKTAAPTEAPSATELPPGTAVVAGPETPKEETHEQAKGEASPEETPSAEAPAPTVTTSRSLPQAKRGTAAATDRSAMSSTLLNRQAKVKAAGISAGEKAPVFPTTARPSAAVHKDVPIRPVAPASEPLSSATAQPEAEPTAPVTANSTALPAATPEAAMTKAERIAHDANVTLDHVERMTETLHTTGRQQVELEVKLHDDSKVTISIQLERGELKTTFKTDSAGLRDALAQNWGQVAEKSSDRSLRLNPPVFESSDARNGFSGDSRQQPRDGRTFTQAEAEGQPFTFRPPAKSATPSTPSTPRAASDSALELYA